VPALLPRYASRFVTLVELGDQGDEPFEWLPTFSGASNLTVAWPLPTTQVFSTIGLIGVPTLRRHST
jgi:hypothetical protein